MTPWKGLLERGRVSVVATVSVGCATSSTNPFNGMQGTSPLLGVQGAKPPGRASACDQIASHAYTSRVRSSGVKLFFTAGNQCSASVAGVQPVLRCMMRIGRG